jgi:hypothetical protein
VYNVLSTRVLVQYAVQSECLVYLASRSFIFLNRHVGDIWCEDPAINTPSLSSTSPTSIFCLMMPSGMERRLVSMFSVTVALRKSATGVGSSGLMRELYPSSARLLMLQIASCYLTLPARNKSLSTKWVKYNSLQCTCMNFCLQFSPLRRCEAQKVEGAFTKCSKVVWVGSSIDPVKRSPKYHQIACASQRYA